MKKLLLGVVSLWLAFATPAFAVNVNIDGLPAATSAGGTDLLECEQAGTNNKCTAAQEAAYVYGLMSGDATTSGTGAHTLATVNSNVGSFGSATQCTAVTVNAKGLTTAASAVTCTPAIGSITGLGTGVATLLAGASSGTGGPAGTASPTFTGTPAAPTATVGTNTTQIATTAFVLANAGSGAVSSVTAGCGLTISPTTGAVVASANVTTTNSTGTTDTIANTQCGTIITENNAASVAVAITTTGFVTGNYFTVKDLGAGVATYTPSSGTIDGAATLVCSQNQSADLYFDGTNYKTLASSCRLDVSGTAALGTTAISSGACATVVTVSAAGVATTDTVMFGYNGDPTAVTGYGASATGAVLSVYPYPSSGNVNVKVCNSTASSITPGALTLNWRVLR